jgi:hypothetical protein
LVPPKNLLAQLFGVALATPHKFNDNQGDHRNDRIIAVDWLQVEQDLIECARHERNFLGIENAPVLPLYLETKSCGSCGSSDPVSSIRVRGAHGNLFDEPQKCLFWHGYQRGAVTRRKSNDVKGSRSDRAAHTARPRRQGHRMMKAPAKLARSAGASPAQARTAIRLEASVA